MNSVDMAKAGRRGAGLGVAVAIALVTVAVYAQVSRFGFVDFDDGPYVPENEMVQAGLTAEGVAWAFTTDHPPYWHPITWLSLMLDCQLFGPSPGGHHLVNLLIHVLASLVLLVALRRLTGDLWPSAFVAAVFAVHPLHVESVAWIAERKDVLSGLLFALALWAWSGYARRPGPGRYALVAVLFALGLMAKPMLVTLPAVLLLLDFWPLRRAGEGGEGGVPRRSLAALIVEKLPLLALSIALSVVTFLAQEKAGAVKSLEGHPLGARLANAIVSYTSYVGKTVWPADLSVIYHLPDSWPALRVAGSALGLAVMTVAVATARSRPHLLVGWLWFLGTLVPVIGIVQVGRQALADRFMYLPMIGLLIMVAWSVPRAWRAGGHTDRRSVAHGRAAVALSAVLVVGVLAAVSWRQVGHWRDTVTLWEHAVAVSDDNPVAVSNLAWIYATHPDEDLRDGDAAVRLIEPINRARGFTNPGHLDTLAAAYAEAGRFDEALAAVQRAIDVLRAARPDMVDFIADLEARRDLYLRREPYREARH